MAKRNSYIECADQPADKIEKIVPKRVARPRELVS
jgi:hypothetical protein